jgi:hypothetical protein
MRKKLPASSESLLPCQMARLSPQEGLDLGARGSSYVCFYVPRSRGADSTGAAHLGTKLVVCSGGSDAILQEYYNKIGGRPVQKSPSRGASSARKRGRNSTSTAVTPAKSSKKTRVSIATKSVDVDSPSEARWEPPAGSWEDHITHIDTIEKSDNGLVCYLQWYVGIYISVILGC